MHVTNPRQRSARGAGTLSLLFGLLLFVPLLVLGTSINWPASLDSPASEIMPLIVDEDAAVKFGYAVYLIYSILFFPVIFTLTRLTAGSFSTRIAIGFAAVSTLGRAIGIIRWLSVLPALALAYRSNPDAAIPVVFDALNTYGGAIGELLGVSVFGALAVAFVSYALLRSVSVPKWLAYFGFLASLALLLPWLEVFGMNLGAALTIGVAFVQGWFITLGIVLIVRRKVTIVGSAS